MYLWQTLSKFTESAGRNNFSGLNKKTQQTLVLVESSCVSILQCLSSVLCAHTDLMQYVCLYKLQTVLIFDPSKLGLASNLLTLKMLALHEFTLGQ